MQAGKDSHRQTGFLSLGGCADTEAQTVLVRGQSGAGDWYPHTHKGNPTPAQAVAPHVGTTVSVLQGGRCRLRMNQGEEEPHLHRIRSQQKAGYRPHSKLLTFIPTAPGLLSTKRQCVPHCWALVLSLSSPESLSLIPHGQQSHPILRDPFLCRHLSPPC